MAGLELVGSCRCTWRWRAAGGDSVGVSRETGDLLSVGMSLLVEVGVEVEVVVGFRGLCTLEVGGVIGVGD